jgi:hypothetical protein
MVRMGRHDLPPSAKSHLSHSEWSSFLLVNLLIPNAARLIKEIVHLTIALQAKQARQWQARKRQFQG